MAPSLPEATQIMGPFPAYSAIPEPVTPSPLPLCEPLMSPDDMLITIGLPEFE